MHTGWTAGGTDRLRQSVKRGLTGSVATQSGGLLMPSETEPPPDAACLGETEPPLKAGWTWCTHPRRVDTEDC